jgi:hypothetical protein
MGVKGTLHLIEDDLGLWLPHIATITLAQIEERLSMQLAFYEYLRLRAEAMGEKTEVATDPVTEPADSLPRRERPKLLERQERAVQDADVL